MSGLNIVCCVKVVPKNSEIKIDPETKGVDRRGVDSIINGPDKNAVEAAVRLKELYGGKVTLLSMAPPGFDDFWHILMAMGCDEMVLLSDRAFALADSYPTVLTLAEGIKKIGNVDLVLTGVESADGGTGNVPPGLGEALGFSQATYVEEIDYDAEKERFIVHRLNGNGHEVIGIPKPAVASIELAANSPRFPDFRKKVDLDANYKLTVWSNEDLQLPENKRGLSGSFTIVDRFVEAKSRERKHEKVTGTNEEIAEKLADIIIQNMKM
ncbi:MAG: electron transfer flavoprotein subunit beta/FixA family protein [Candidatus Heimdallarchaeota archaeon]|nr:electron transfer flavoprotein subunit beta/FixA family protein [Candidatus Heimdallarchaeota archaeon]